MRELLLPSPSSFLCLRSFGSFPLRRRSFSSPHIHKHPGLCVLHPLAEIDYTFFLSGSFLNLYRRNGKRLPPFPPDVSVALTPHFAPPPLQSIFRGRTYCSLSLRYIGGSDFSPAVGSRVRFHGAADALCSSFLSYFHRPSYPVSPTLSIIVGKKEFPFLFRSRPSVSFPGALTGRATWVSEIYEPHFCRPGSYDKKMYLSFFFPLCDATPTIRLMRTSFSPHFMQGPSPSGAADEALFDAFLPT